LTALGFLDEENYFLLDSNHNLFARALEIKGWKCGYIPMEFKSPLKEGSARKQTIDKRIRSLNQQVLLLKAARPNNGFLTTMNQWKQPAIETMPLQSDWRHTAPSGHQSVHSHRPSQDQSTNAP
jgi:hypothetical protein